MQRTLDEVRRDRFKVLRQHLARAYMIRFLQQFEIGRVDYIKERHPWVGRISLDEICRNVDQSPAGS